MYAWNPQDEEDLYQEVLFQIWRGLPGLKEQTHANTWLYRVALNTAISFVRKNTAAGRRNIPVADDHLHALVEHHQPPVADRNPKVDALYEAIAQLDKVEKAVITLFLEDFSYEEIGEVLGLSANHVGVALHRTRKKLSLLLKEEQP